MSDEKKCPPVSVCPQCGTHFCCGVTAGEAHCWCFDLPPVASVPFEANSADTADKPLCLCETCLRQRKGLLSPSRS